MENLVVCLNAVLPLLCIMLLGCLAAPVASTSFTMAQQMGADAEIAGDAVVFSSLLCPLTIFVWCVLAKNLGLM